MGLYDETCKKEYDNNIFSVGLAFYVEIIRKNTIFTNIKGPISLDAAFKDMTFMPGESGFQYLSAQVTSWQKSAEFALHEWNTLSCKN